MYIHVVRALLPSVVVREVLDAVALNHINRTIIKVNKEFLFHFHHSALDGARTHDLGLIRSVL